KKSDDGDYPGHQKELPVFHRRKEVQKLRAKMRTTDALGIGGNCQNGKIDVMPITWKRACARDSEKTAASFALPYGRGRKRTRRIKSATLWINGGKAAPSYAFKKRRMILQRREFANYLRVNSGVKAYRI